MSFLERPLGCSALDVGDGRWVPTHADNDRSVERRVRLAVAPAVEAVTAVRLARRCRDRAGAAELGERGVRADAIAVVSRSSRVNLPADWRCVNPIGPRASRKSL
jgi:hypothetical protein